MIENRKVLTTNELDGFDKVNWVCTNNTFLQHLNGFINNFDYSCELFYAVFQKNEK